MGRARGARVAVGCEVMSSALWAAARCSAAVVGANWLLDLEGLVWSRGRTISRVPIRRGVTAFGKVVARIDLDVLGRRTGRGVQRDVALGPPRMAQRGALSWDNRRRAQSSSERQPLPRADRV
eukprot:3333224-Prymnesium_polylepis.1